MLIVDDKAISNDIKLMEQKLEEVRELAKHIQRSTDIKVVLMPKEKKYKLT